MTARKTVPTPDSTPSATSAVEALAASSQLRSIDPATLLVRSNVRKELKLDNAFKLSIREVGVLEPITAYDTPEGLVVLRGHRRAAAAAEVKLTAVPVVVVPAPADADRILTQVAENVQRTAIDLVESTAAAMELALFDVSVEAIASKTGLSENLVRSASAVAKSKTATATLTEHPTLSLDTVAIIARFDDQPEQQAELLAFAKKEPAWRVTDRAVAMVDDIERNRILDEIQAARVAVLVERPDHHKDARTLPLALLHTDPECEHDLTELDLDALVRLAGDRLRGYPTVEGHRETRQWRIGYAIADWWDLDLHVDSYVQRNLDEQKTKRSTISGDEAAAAKEERRIARENTKEWQAATVRRIEFLAELLTRKTAPTGWDTIVAHRIVRELNYNSGTAKLALQLLGVTEFDASKGYAEQLRDHLATQPTKAWRVMLAMVLTNREAAHEFDRKGWDHTRYFVNGDTTAAEHLDQLVRWGYQPADIEQALITAAAKSTRKKTAA